MVTTSSFISGQLLLSLWKSSVPNVGATPSTAVAPDYTTTGALGQVALNSFRILMARMAAGLSTTVGTGLLIADRLSHQGGLSGTTTGAQTTNLPTAALTRSTSGVGVMAAIEVYTSVGASGGTVVGSYTNSSGTAGRTFKERGLGFNGPNTAGVLSLFGLQDGDVGVRSVESITLSGSTGTAGNFGVTLFKPYGVITVNSNEAHEFDAITAMGAVMPLIPAAACLWLSALYASGTTPLLAGELLLAED